MSPSEACGGQFLGSGSQCVYTVALADVRNIDAQALSGGWRRTSDTSSAAQVHQRTVELAALGARFAATDRGREAHDDFHRQRVPQKYMYRRPPWPMISLSTSCQVVHQSTSVVHHVQHRGVVERLKRRCTPASLASRSGSVSRGQRRSMSPSAR
jgi:hypothetical protein